LMSIDCRSQLNSLKLNYTTPHSIEIFVFLFYLASAEWIGVPNNQVNLDEFCTFMHY